jgi:membrane-bound serine protease (ClpP class)
MEVYIPIILMLIGVIAIVMELFIPSAGIIGVIGLACIVCGVVFAYKDLGVVMGTVFLLGAVICVPLMIALSFKVFPQTYFGKKLILTKSEEKTDGFRAHGNDYQDLIGQEGQSVTFLHPTGIALFNEKKYNVLTSGDFVEKNSNIKVVAIKGNNIIVKKI